MTLTKTIVSVSLMGLLVACGGAPKKIPELEQARASYDAASADESMVRYASDELDTAKIELNAAERNFKQGDETRAAIHHATLAQKRIDLARLIVERNEADKSLQSMDKERQQAQLDLRSEEIDEKRRLLEQERLNAERAQLEAESLKQQMAELQAKKTERGMVLTLGDVLFAVNEATLKPGAERNINKIADFLKSQQEKTVIIEGHTDSMGDDGYNMKLSENRADAVRQGLLLRGVESYRISTRGFGETLPVASNNDQAGRQRNRRVEVIFPDTSNSVVENYVE